MKKISMLVLLVVAVATGSFVWADHHEKGEKHDHAGWFDSASCDVCNPWSKNPQLMMSTKWETHLIKNGMLMTSVVPEEHQQAFEKVCKQCEKNHETVGKNASMCGFCEAMGGLMAAGVQMEEVKTDFGKITLMTSDDASTVKKIHEVAKKSQEEAKKMMAMLKQ